MNDIPKARDVLATWRERATEGPWNVIDGVYSQEGMTYDGSQIEAEHEMVAMDHQDLDCGPVAPLGYSDARLIVLTAGNPELLDAWDKLLHEASCWPLAAELGDSAMTPFIAIAEQVAAAIIAADQRMQQ